MSSSSGTPDLSAESISCTSPRSNVNQLLTCQSPESDTLSKTTVDIDFDGESSSHSCDLDAFDCYLEESSMHSDRDDDVNLCDSFSSDSSCTGSLNTPDLDATIYSPSPDLDHNNP